MSADEVALVVALMAPVVGAAGAAVLGRKAGRQTVQAAVLVATGLWAVLLATDSAARVGIFHCAPLVAAAGCGAGLLLLCARRDRAPRKSPPAGAIAMAAIGFGLSAGAPAGNALGVIAGLSVAALWSGAAGWDPKRVAGAISPTLAAIGVIATGFGFILTHADLGTWALPTAAATDLSDAAVVAFLIGAAALCIAGGLRPHLSATLLVAAGLVVGLRAAPLLTAGTDTTLSRSLGSGLALVSADGLPAASIVFAALAIAFAGLRRTPLAIAMVALGLAAGPATMVPASRLMGAAAVLALAVDRPAASLLAFPALAAAAAGAIESGSDAAAIGAALVGVVIAATAVVDHRRRSARPWDPFALPAVAAGAWLLVAPASWTWTGAKGLLRPYDLGSARAWAAGLLAAVAVVLWLERPARPEPEEVELVRSESSAP